jgi:Zn-dependent protease
MSTVAFTQEALAAIDAAKHYAAHNNGAIADPDYLALGLLKPLEGTPDEQVYSLLATTGIDPSPIAELLREQLSIAPPTTPNDESRHARELQQAIDRASAEADAVGSSLVNTSHLLLGALSIEMSRARALFGAVGLTVETLQEQLRPLPDQDSDTQTFMALHKKTSPSLLFVSIAGTAIISGILLALNLAPDLTQLLTIVFIVCAWIVAVCVHEFGHCLAAYFGGDRGVIARGGLTLDPRLYGHPLLSIGLPLLFLLGGSIALPGGVAPVDGGAIRSRRWQMAVALGGPLGTLLCLLLATLPFFVIDTSTASAGLLALLTALAGFAAAVASVLILTLLPIPPLDGFHFIAPWLPAKLRERGFSFGWTPLLLLYLVLSQANPLSYAYWSINTSFAALLNIPPWLASLGLGMLSFR